MQAFRNLYNKKPCYYIVGQLKKENFQIMQKFGIKIILPDGLSKDEKNELKKL